MGGADKHFPVFSRQSHITAQGAIELHLGWFPALVRGKETRGRGERGRR